MSKPKKQWFAPRTAGAGQKSGQKFGRVQPVRLSQCMIVKNEVFHFEWINDFAAARNFALSKAKGNWIAFLDADEYLRGGDAPLLLKIIERINPDARYQSLTLPLANLKDDGQVGAVVMQQRIFRNSVLKYTGAIHENLVPARADTVHASAGCREVNIIHTGYTTAEYAEKNKLARNIEMLRRELESKPDDPNVKAYLADSLYVKHSPGDVAEVKQLYTESLLGEKPMFPKIKENSYPKFLLLCRNYDLDLYYRAAERAVSDFPDIGTFSLHYGAALYLKGDYDRAWTHLRKAEDFLKDGDVMKAQDILGYTFALFELLLKCAEARDDEQAMVKYAVLFLREDKSQVGVLGPLICKFRQNGADDDAILDVLRKIYNFEDPRDVITAAKGAEDAGAEELMNRLKETANSLLDALA